MTDADKQRIDAAVAQAQAGTTGHVTVRIVPDASVDAFERAKAELQRAGLHKNAARNTALLLVAPQAHRFAVIGDRALDQRVGGESFWQQLAADMRPKFSGDSIVDGIVYGVQKIGEALRTHFPEQA